jgi:hypothetical protein
VAKKSILLSNKMIDCFTIEIRNYVAKLYKEIQLFFELNISIFKSIITLIDRRYYNLRMVLCKLILGQDIMSF